MMSDTTTATTHSTTGGLATSTRHRSSREQRRADVIEASKTAEIIDLTNEGLLATVTNFLGGGNDRAKPDGGDMNTVSDSLETS